MSNMHRSALRPPAAPFPVCAAVLVGLLLGALPTSAALKSVLQGQHKGSTNWNNGPLLGWQELDLIPVRHYFTGGPASNQVLTIEFDHSKSSGAIRGIQNLTGFVTSSNVLITAAPTLNSAPGVDIWTYTYTVTVRDGQPGFVEFRARLAAGAHLFTGSSLSLGKPTLSIFKPAAAPGQPDLAVRKTGAFQAGPGDVLNYAVIYTNKTAIGVTAIGVQVSDSLPVGMDYVPGSASHGGTVVGNTITWDLGDLAPGAWGSLTYKVRISTNLVVNTALVNDAQILSSQDDLTPTDNRATFTTTIVPDPQPVAHDDAYGMPENLTLVIAPTGVLSNDTVDLPVTLTSWLVSPPNHGQLNLDTNGGFSYTPNTNFVGADFFTYRALALTNFSGPAVVTITVTNTDTQPPVINCPANLVVSNDLGQCGAVVGFTVTAVDDQDGPVPVASAPTNGSYFPLGTTVVTNTATDTSANIASCTFTVTVVDAEAPVLTCPADVVVSNTLDQCGAIVHFAVSATDNCSTPTVVATPVSGSNFPVGTTVVTATAADASGNTSTCTFTVTVVDAQLPQITCPTNRVVVVPYGSSYAVVTFPPPVATDNCGVVWTNCSMASGSVFPLGTTIVSCEAADAAGNRDVCSFTVTVNAEAPPEADLAVARSVSTVSNQLGGQFLITLTATNLGPDAAPGVVLFNPLPSGSEFSSATHGLFTNGAITFAISNLAPGAGTNFSLVLTASEIGSLTNTTTISSAIYDPFPPNNTATLLLGAFDVQPPVITCPADLVVSNDPGQCEAQVTFAVLAVDDHDGTVPVVSTPPSGSVFPLGTTVVTNTATDASGNIATCTFTVTMVDGEPPVIGCPSDLLLPNDPGVCGAVVSFTVSATDNCSVPAVTSVPASDSVFPTGTTVVNSVATDAAGNASVCTFRVTVVDVEPPQITCPANIVEEVPYGSKNAVVTFPSPVATDNCEVIWTNCSMASGSLFPLGTTIVSCEAADAAGNRDVCSFTVTVNAEPPPAADLAVFKSASIVESEVGDQILFTLTATNQGPDLATGVVLFNSLPPGLDFTAATNGIFTNGGIIFALANLPAGAGTNFTEVLTATSVGLLTNTTTISSDVFDPFLPNNTASAVVMVRLLQVLDLQALVASPMTLNLQTGLIEQTILLTNAGNVAVAGARVFLCFSNLPPTTVYNRDGDTNGCAYMDYPSPLAPGDSVTFQMQYYLRFEVDDPQLSVEVIQPPAPPVVQPTPPVFDRVQVQPDGVVLLEFTAIAGRTYTLQYSDDHLQSWKTAVPSVTAASNRVQWLDAGPPKTEVHPRSRASRLYRVLLVNP
jgi:uncharacterized repeat protein (TIGR01451 family)